MLATIPRYLKHTMGTGTYNWSGGKAPVCVLTFVSVRKPAHAMKPGDIKDDGAGNWLFACPKCGLVGYLDHTVTILLDRISISPSIECPNPECGFHEVVSGWELRKNFR